MNLTTKNPLLAVNLFFCFNCMMYLLPFASKFAKGMAIIDILAGNAGRVTGLSLSVLFIICYFKKNIFAWWIASLFLGIMFVAKIIIKNEFPDIRLSLVFLIMYVFVLCYLLPKYEIYKKYIAGNEMSDGFEVLEAEGLHPQDESTDSKPRNPLQAVISATVTLTIFELSYLFPIGKKPTNYQEILMFFSPQGSVLLLLFILLFAYHKKSIIAWWVSMIHIPVMWMVYNSFNPFNIIQFAITAVIFAIMAGYLIMKYKPYQAYISTKDESAGL